MNAERFLHQLKRFPVVLSALVADLTPEELKWRLQESDWSILEVLCHLLDEETEDFRTRLRMTLERPGESWPPIDPVQAAIDRQYRQQDTAEILQRFTANVRHHSRGFSSLSHRTGLHSSTIPNSEFFMPEIFCLPGLRMTCCT